MVSNDNLNELAARANEAHNGVISSFRTAIHHAKDAGDALRAAKKRVGHGNWLTWLKKHFNASPETARVYMRISEYWQSQILPAMKNDDGLTIEKARDILRRPPSEIEEGAMPLTKTDADMARDNLSHYFKNWLKDIPEEGVLCLYTIWNKVWCDVIRQLLEEMERCTVKETQTAKTKTVVPYRFTGGTSKKFAAPNIDKRVGG